MSAFRRIYRNGTDEYDIEITAQPNGTYKLHCHAHPDNPFSAEVTRCHLYSSGAICIAAGKEPRTLDAARAIAKFFASGYSQYIRTGVFPNAGASVHVS